MRNLLAPLACALVMASCGSSSPSTAAGANTGNTVTCSGDSQVQVYTPGMKAVGTNKVFTFVITQASPAPPATNENTWTVQVLDASNQPVSGATVALQPFMPTMGHGSSQTPQVAASGNSYTISNIDLFMPGLWSMTLTATSGNQSDSGIFYFCVNG